MVPSGPPGPRRAALARLGATAIAMAIGGRCNHAAAQKPPSAAAQPTIVEFEVADARLELQFEAAFEAPARAAVAQAVRRAAAAVAEWLGRFPVPELDIQIGPAVGTGLVGGTAFPDPMPWLRLRASPLVDDSSMRDDWVLVHELIHLALPQLPPAQRWFHEGVATYGEAMIRTRAGWVAEAALWAGFVRGMPLGQPLDGDRGLDRTPTWARTYWGGALLCLQADLRWRRAGAAGLRQALQGVLAAGGSYRVAWPLQRVLAVADAAVGGQVLADLHAEHGLAARTIDLGALWAELGVQPLPDGGVRLSEAASARQLRQSLIQG